MSPTLIAMRTKTNRITIKWNIKQITIHNVL